MTLEEKHLTVLAEVDKILPPVPCLRVTPVRGKAGVFDSKLGGVPYLPKGFPYPTVKEGEFRGRPLKFLAQLNFGTLPSIPDFPEKGILQFYCSCDGDDVIGLEYDPPFNQNCYRVIYHENVITDEAKLVSAEEMPKFIAEEDRTFPLEGEFLLKAEQPEIMAVSFNDFRFAKAERECYAKLFGDDGDKDDDIYYKLRLSNGSFIGGYPYLTQFDPRGWKKHFEVCDTLLFQLDSIVSGNQEIMWGDGGVGSFFINRADLKNRDFSRVLYHWDCG